MIGRKGKPREGRLMMVGVAVVVVVVVMGGRLIRRSSRIKGGGISSSQQPPQQEFKGVLAESKITAFEMWREMLEFI